MRWNGWLIAVLAMTFVGGGCSKKADEAADSEGVTSGGMAEVTVDTAPVEKSFAQAEASDKVTLDQAVESIKAGDYSPALVGLTRLASKASLTPEQKKAVQDLMDQIKAKAEAMAGQAAAEGEKAIESGKRALDGMKNALPGEK